MSVKSTYNFVPALNEEEVFKPDWGNQVSHDVPFSDGESGEIELKITAQTPIFIRNGHSKNQEENEFSHFIDADGEKQYFIPGSSLKGMFRNVLEIMSFGRLKTENNIFPFRNLKHEAYIKSVMANRNIKTGWLQKNNDRWVIRECNHKRIPITSVEREFKIGINNKTAVEKYKLMGETPLEIKAGYSGVLGLTKKDGGFIKTGELFDFNLTDNEFKGELVFYGSMANKKYEYIFGSGREDGEYEVSNDLFRKFEEINENIPDSLWTYFKNTNRRKIPVFFYQEKDNVKHFGFSRLYKLANTNSIYELNPVKSYPKLFFNDKLDLPHVIFGATLPTKNNRGQKDLLGLKGRVTSGNGKCLKLVKYDNVPVTVVLNSPKASYFPFYLKGTKTYLDTDAELSGYKKYPVHNTVKNSILNKDNLDIQSKFNPLGIGTEFLIKVRFHNLKKIEIGALLSSITFHGNSDKFSYSLGAAKPLGYGKVKVDLQSLRFLNHSFDEYLSAFEEQMNEHQRDWLKSDQVQQLFAMSNMQIPKSQNDLLIYPQLEPNNEFLGYTSLPTFGNHNLEINSIAKKHNAKKEEEEKKRENALKAEAYKKEQELVILLKNSDNPVELEKFISDYPTNEMVSEFRINATEIRRKRKEEEAEKLKEVQLECSSNKFRKNQEYLNSFYKKNKLFSFSDSQKNQIEDCMRRCWKDDNIAFFKKKKLAKLNEFPWTDIQKWLGHSRAQSLYNELNSPS